MTTVATRLAGALVWPRTLDDLIELVAPLHSSNEIRAPASSLKHISNGLHHAAMMSSNPEEN